MSWDVDKPSRRVLVRNLPAGASNQSLHDFFIRYGEIVETFVPIDPQTRRPRVFGFVEFRNMADAQTVRDTVAEVDGQRVSIVFVESKRTEEESRYSHRSSTSTGVPSGPSAPSAPLHQSQGINSHSHTHGGSHSGTGRLQPPPVAPPPPVNPNTETYRYNTMAGEFVIDGSGRLTRRRDFDDLEGGTQGNPSEGGNRTTVGLGGGLLVGVGDVTMRDAENVELYDIEERDLNMINEEYSSGVLFDTKTLDELLKPSEVIDFADI